MRIDQNPHQTHPPNRLWEGRRPVLCDHADVLAALHLSVCDMCTYVYCISTFVASHPRSSRRFYPFKFTAKRMR